MRSNLRRKEQRMLSNKKENAFYISYTCSTGESHGHHTTKRKQPDLVEFIRFLNKKHDLKNVRVTACIQIAKLPEGITLDPKHY